MTSLNLQSSDGEIFAVSEDVFLQFGTIRTMLEILGEKNISRDSNLPLPNVDSETLRILIDWATFQVTKKTTEIYCPNTDLDRYKLDPDQLMKLVRAADYLDIEPLLDIGCRDIGDLITGKSFNEMKILLNFDVETPKGLVI